MIRKTMHDRKQTFTIMAPGAGSVLLAGDFTHWQQWPIPLHRHTGGLWKTTVDLEPGTYHYRFIVDGQWRDDPGCAQQSPNPYGTQDAVRQVA